MERPPISGQLSPRVEIISTLSVSDSIQTDFRDSAQVQRVNNWAQVTNGGEQREEQQQLYDLEDPLDKIENNPRDISSNYLHNGRRNVESSKGRSRALPLFMDW